MIETGGGWGSRISVLMERHEIDDKQYKSLFITKGWNCWWREVRARKLSAFTSYWDRYIQRLALRVSFTGNRYSTGQAPNSGAAPTSRADCRLTALIWLTNYQLTVEVEIFCHYIFFIRPHILLPAPCLTWHFCRPLLTLRHGCLFCFWNPQT